MKKIYFLLLFSVLCLLACNNDDGLGTPKPRGYPRIAFPEDDKLMTFDGDYCNFTFEHPSYAKIEQDESSFDEKPQHPCWFDINVPELNAKIYCCYYPIDGRNSFEKLRSDAFSLANKHTIKADFIDEIPIQKPGVSGFLFDIKGSVASPFQFYLTDSTSHFMRGSLYVNAKAQADSLAPIYDFMKKDIMHIINTFEWNE